MDPCYPHGQYGRVEANNKKGKDMHQPYSKESYPYFGTNPGMQVFDDSLIVNKSKSSRKNRDQKADENPYVWGTPRVGTFEHKSYYELLHKSKELFDKRHHILAKLSWNGVYDELTEDDVDLVALMKDTLNQPDVLYKETSKAVIQTCKATYTIQNLIKDKVSNLTPHLLM